MSSTTALERIEGTARSIAERARRDFDPGQVELMRQTVAANLTYPEFGQFLEVAARYGLDPFTGQVYAAKIDGKVVPIVAKHGLLGLAERHRDFRGCPSDVVREHDLFRKVTHADGSITVEHEYRDANGNPTHGGPDGALRGKIVGAWALCHREGKPSAYFFAYFATYNKGRAAWKTHPDAMIRKCAQAAALRDSYSLSGLYVAEEVGERGDGEPVNLTAGGQASRMELDYGDDPERAESLKALFDALRYTDRKRSVRLMTPEGTRLDAHGIDALIAALVQECRDQGVTVPIAEADGQAEEVVAEAEVVPEGGDAGHAIADLEAALEAATDDDERADLEKQLAALRGSDA